jgi:hypothetical protein
MSDAGARGPEVAPAENLYRAIHDQRWWIADRAQPLSSAAFSWPVFSVNIATLMSLEEAVRHLREVLKSEKGGIVAFNCGDAKGLGFDPRKEADQNYPQNKAHANVYSDGNDSKRKTRAKKLAASYCHVMLEPSF